MTFDLASASGRPAAPCLHEVLSIVDWFALRPSALLEWRCVICSFRGPHLVDQCFERLPVRHRTVGLVGLAGLTDGSVEVAEFLGFVLGFVQVADGEEAVGWL